MSAVAQPEAAPVRGMPVRRRDTTHALSGRPWVWALALAIPLGVAYLVWSPPAADLAAATYRSDLFARVGYVLKDNGWYAAHPHYVIGYSLLSPPLGALLGVRLLMVVSALAACALFALIAERAFGARAGRAAAVVFAFGMSVELLSGRVPYDLGLAIGLGAVLATMRGRTIAAVVLAVLTSAASPVAGAFLAMAFLVWGAAVWLVERRRGKPVEGSRAEGRSDAYRTASGGEDKRQHGTAGQHDTARAQFTPAWAVLCAAAALAPVAAMSAAFPEGGYEPFALSAFWPACAGVVAIALFLPRERLGERAYVAVRASAWTYALALAASYAAHTPMGGNAARLGPELAPAIVTGVLWERRRLALALVAPLLVYWQINTPIGDLSQIYGQESVHADYYAPLLAAMKELRHGRPTVVEVPLTAAHMEAAYVAGHDGILLARGWDRQLDTRYDALFYRPVLSAAAYRLWLRENRVQYVALPDALPDYAAATEVALIRRGVPYLREVWRSRHWRLFAVAA